ncbi:MAG TPA: DUF922 domain-containing protein, partial [Flavitalea sp.]|nr:DUF922 domain-containing protein [Flavitalea sp.]
ELSPGKIKLTTKGKSVAIAEVDIRISVIKSDSWVIVDKQSDYLLKHEQGHYDILAISAREFYNSLMKMSAASAHELQTMVTNLQEEVQKRVARVDARYDDQTKHSLDKTVQDSWDKKIAAEKQKPDGSIDNLP